MVRCVNFMVKVAVELQVPYMQDTSLTPPCQQFFVKGNRSTSRKPTTFNRALAAQLFSHTKCYRTYRTSKVKDTLRHDEATAMPDINSKQK